MSGLSGKRGISAAILEVLKKHSNNGKPLTSADIAYYLEQEYDIKPARNTIRDNITALCELEFPISTFEDNGKGTYYDENSLFIDEEIRVLVDSILTSRYIPEKHAKDLINKLISLASQNFNLKVKHIHPLNEWNHRRNKEFFWTLSQISEAIEEKRQIIFTYNIITPKGTLEPKNNRKYIIHPFEIICTNGQYYLIGSYGKFDDLRHYRLDRITDIEKREKKVRPLKTIPEYTDGLKLSKYAVEHHLMFGGPTAMIKMKMPVERAGDVLDAFGTKASMKDLGNGFMEIYVKAAPEGIRYFAMQFAGNCEILEPFELRNSIKLDIMKIYNLYID